jgi:hypothetical protein
VNLVPGIVILAVPGLGLGTFAILFGIGLLVRGAAADRRDTPASPARLADAETRLASASRSPST